MANPVTGERIRWTSGNLHDDDAALVEQLRVSRGPGDYATSLAPRARETEADRAMWPGGGRAMPHAGPSCDASRLALAANSRGADGAGRISCQLPGTASAYRAMGDGQWHVRESNELMRDPWRGGDDRKQARHDIAETDFDRWECIRAPRPLPVEAYAARGGVSSRAGTAYSAGGRPR